MYERIAGYKLTLHDFSLLHSAQPIEATDRNTSLGARDELVLSTRPMQASIEESTSDSSRSCIVQGMHVRTPKVQTAVKGELRSIEGDTHDLPIILQQLK